LRTQRRRCVRFPGSKQPNTQDVTANHAGSNQPELNTWIASLLYDPDIDERSCIPHWTSGDRMDWDLGIWHMFQIDEKAQRRAN
jgi:hypothetical protein